MSVGMELDARDEQHNHEEERQVFTEKNCSLLAQESIEERSKSGGHALNCVATKLPKDCDRTFRKLMYIGDGMIVKTQKPFWAGTNSSR